MQRIATDLHRTAGLGELRTFLGACQAELDDAADWRIVSIALAVRHIDALAVLDSIYEPDSWHAYLENPACGWALAGAEAVALGTFNGPDRFAAARDFARDLSARTIVIGDVAHPFAGPHCFCAFAFTDDAAAAAPFPAAAVLLPQWQVGRRGNSYVAVANCRIDAATDIAALADRLWRAHGKFSVFDYTQLDPGPAPRVTSRAEVGDPGLFRANVGRALAAIRAGRYAKIVLARAVDHGFDRPCQPLRVLGLLRERFPACHLFSIANPGGQSWIGASPERLLEVTGGELVTEAIAGSAPRGAHAAEDAQHARALLASDKDLREHRHVIDSIARRLDGLGVTIQAQAEPELLDLANVRHLRTPIRATLPAGLHLLDLAAALHPTPAVGGTPREAALPDIAQWEPCPRGLYAGLVGWIDPDGGGACVVAIRSARVDGARMRLFAGAGIVAGSDADAEQRETEIKMQALADAVGG
jgi:menaquinone-specific isochorismate synthase